MPADPFLNITKADERLLEQARKRGPAALKRVTMAIAKRAVITARLKDEQRERESFDSEDRSWPPRYWRRRAAEQAERAPESSRSPRPKQAPGASARGSGVSIATPQDTRRNLPKVRSPRTSELEQREW